MDNSQSSHADATPGPLEPAHNPEHMLSQIGQRLIDFSLQLDNLRAQVNSLESNLAEDSIQLNALVHHLTDTQHAGFLQERLADFVDQLRADHDQLTYLSRKIADTATQEQLVRLASRVPSQDQVAELSERVIALERAIQRTAALDEAKDQQLEGILGTLQDIAIRREQLAERKAPVVQEQIEEVRQAARGELAAELLPALDNLDTVLRSGQQILAQYQRHDQGAERRSQEADPEDRQPSGRLLNRLRSRLAGDLDDESSMHGLSNRAIETLGAWVRQISLARERFITILDSEGVTPIQTQNQPFDPRFHVAIDSEATADVPPNTVIREVRRGYLLHGRVLRFAEVIVASAVPPLQVSPRQPDRNRPGPKASSGSDKTGPSE